MCRSRSSKTGLVSRIRKEFLQIIKKKETRFLNRQSLQRATHTANQYIETRLDVRRASEHTEIRRICDTKCGDMDPWEGTYSGRHKEHTWGSGVPPTHRPGTVSSMEASEKVDRPPVCRGGVHTAY